MGKTSEGGNAPERPGEIMAHIYTTIVAGKGRMSLSKCHTFRSPKGFHGLLTQPSPSVDRRSLPKGGEGWEEGQGIINYPEGVALSHP